MNKTIIVGMEIIAKVGRNEVEAVVIEVAETGIKAVSKKSGKEFQVKTIVQVLTPLVEANPVTEPVEVVEAPQTGKEKILIDSSRRDPPADRGSVQRQRADCKGSGSRPLGAAGRKNTSQYALRSDPPRNEHEGKSPLCQRREKGDVPIRPLISTADAPVKFDRGFSFSTPVSPRRQTPAERSPAEPGCKGPARDRRSASRCCRKSTSKSTRYSSEHSAQFPSDL